MDFVNNFIFRKKNDVSKTRSVPPSDERMGRWRVQFGHTKTAILNQWTTCVNAQPLHMHTDAVKCTALNNFLVYLMMFPIAEIYLYTAA